MLICSLLQFTHSINFNLILNINLKKICYYYKIETAMTENTKKNVKKYLNLIYFLLLMFSSSLFSSENPLPTEFIPQDFDVISYDALLDLSTYPSLACKGECTTTIKWNKKDTSSRYYFNLQSLIVDSVLFDKEKIEVYKYKKEADANFAYYINYKNSFLDTSKLKFFYSGTMSSEKGKSDWGGVHSHGKLLYGIGVGFNANFVSTTRFWLPCFDHPSDKALLSLKMIVADTLEALSNGVLVSRNTIADKSGFSLVEWQENNPCATYLMTFAVGPLKKQVFNQGKMPINVYTPVKDTAKARFTFRKIEENVNYFSEVFSPYPFAQLSYYHALLGNMEHQGMITFAETETQNRYSTKDTINQIAAHELSHQWFGDLVSPLDFRDAWFNESFATFCESLWIQNQKGNQAYIKELEAKKNSYIKSIIKSEGIFPLYNFKRTAPSSNYPQTIYDKGAVVVSMLRYTIGDGNFFTSLKNIFSKYKYSNITTAQIQEEFRQLAGNEVDRFFDNWIYGKLYPKISIQTKYDDNEVNFEFENTNPDSLAYNSSTYLPITIKFSSGLDTNLIYDLNFSQNNKISKKLEINSFINSQYKIDSIIFNKSNQLVSLNEITKSTISNIDYSENNNFDFVISPNPSKHFINIKLMNYSDISFNVNEKLNSKFEYQIIDLNGNILQNGTISQLEEKIPISSFASGKYYIVIKNSILNKIISQSLLIEN